MKWISSYNKMPFWDKFKKKEVVPPSCNLYNNSAEPTVVIMQSESLGMTVI